MEGKQIRAERSHHCEAGEQLRRATREAQEAEDNEALWGPAITRIERAGDQWWAHNEEYSSLIRFCPWCGENLSSAEP